MDLQPAVDHVAGQLAAAAALGDDRTREIADALTATIGPAVRLAVLDALASAVDEINAGLLDVPGTPSVTVRLDGAQASLEVRRVPPGDPSSPDDGDATARISLRLSDTLKNRVEAAARETGSSVNTWLVRAAAAALRERTGDVAASPRRSDARRITGWIN